MLAAVRWREMNPRPRRIWMGAAATFLAALVAAAAVAYGALAQKQTVYASKGSSGQGVRCVKEALNEWHKRTGVGVTLKVTSSYGQGTENQVRAFQRASGLNADGIVGPNTSRFLTHYAKGACVGILANPRESTETLKRGSQGTAVKCLQQALNTWSTAHHLGVDGDFGTQTEAKVRRFQKAMHVPVDGVVGRQTKHQLLMFTGINCEYYFR